MQSCKSFLSSQILPQIPFYGSSGLNAGIMHMNLTRMKSFPGGGWTPAVMKVFDDFRQKIKLADQDMLNILFHKVKVLGVLGERKRGADKISVFFIQSFSSAILSILFFSLFQEICFISHISIVKHSITHKVLWGYQSSRSCSMWHYHTSFLNTASRETL